MSIRWSSSHHLIRLSYHRISFVTNFFCLLCPLCPVCSYHVFLCSYTLSFICLTFCTVRITFFLILPDGLYSATVFKKFISTVCRIPVAHKSCFQVGIFEGSAHDFSQNGHGMSKTWVSTPPPPPPQKRHLNLQEVSRQFQTFLYFVL
jgi:hypothetical protein